MALTQDNREFRIDTPLGPDVLLFKRMSASERLGRLFEYRLELLSENPDIVFDDILGQSVTVRMERGDGSDRFFNGIVSSFRFAGLTGRLARYEATVSPSLWLLTRTADCRIFQHMSVPDIVAQVVGDHGIGPLNQRLSSSYPTWEYCVQYRETDFNFISRLMEQEGIYYFFEHSDGQHEIILADSISAHSPVDSYSEVPYFPPDPTARRETDHIYDWTVGQTVQPGAYELRDFDFEKPRVELRSIATLERGHATADKEIYDYPGEYKVSAVGDVIARRRMEELAAQYERGYGVGNARGLATGALFQFTDFPRDDQNAEYLIAAASYELSNDDYAAAGGAATGPDFVVRIEVLRSAEQYRPERSTPKPVVQGPQTAIVVGASSEEIDTDEYGRVFVQFHWDREGSKDENSSCRVRVAQVWAGKQWGAIHIPRIGQEVIVEFLEGDPDRPLITGRVYNDEQMPPYDLPADKTQSGIKSRSSPGGGSADFNEIRFEDKSGEEQVYLHAQKDLDSIVENNETRNVGNDRTTVIGNDEDLHVKANRKTLVDGNFEETVKGNETRKVLGNEDEQILGTETRKVVGAVSETFANSETRNIALNVTETIGVSETRTIGASQTETVGAAVTTTIGGPKTETIGAVYTQTIAAAGMVTAGAAYMITAPTIMLTGTTVLTTEASHTDATSWKAEAVGFAASATGAKTEATGMAIGVTGMTVEAKGMSIGTTGLKQENEAMEIKGSGLSLKQGALKFITAGLYSVT